MPTTLYVTQNTTGQTEVNDNNINITPSSPDTDYILLVFTEKQNCNNIITALFSNTSKNCNTSSIDINAVDLVDQDLVNGLVHFSENGLYDVSVYYQSSDTNLDPLLATFSYDTCLKVVANSSCSADDFDCSDLDNCDNFNDKLDDAPSDGTTYGRKDGAWEAATGFTLTDGNGTTANGTAVDLGNALNQSTTVLGASNNLTWGTVASPINSHTTNAKNTIKLKSSTDAAFTAQFGEFLLNTYGLDVKGKRSVENWYSRLTAENGIGKLIVSKTNEDDISTTAMGFIMSVITNEFEIINQNTKTGVAYSDVTDLTNFVWSTHTLVAPPVFEINEEFTPGTVTLTGVKTFDTTDGNNGVYSYDSVSDVNFTINSGFLSDGKFAYLTTEDTGNFTIVAGTGIIVSKSGLYTSDGINSTVIITNIKGIYKITGDLA